MSAPPKAIAPNPHTNFLNIYIQIANKMGFQQKKLSSPPPNDMCHCYTGVHAHYSLSVTVI
jgi:hypothetical protein